MQGASSVLLYGVEFLFLGELFLIEHSGVLCPSANALILNRDFLWVGVETFGLIRHLNDDDTQHHGDSKEAASVLHMTQPYASTSSAQCCNRILYSTVAYI